MARQLTWLSDAEWAKIESLLRPGRKGARRVHDQRVISGIVHMLKIDARWRDCPPDKLTTNYITGVFLAASLTFWCN